MNALHGIHLLRYVAVVVAMAAAVVFIQLLIFGDTLDNQGLWHSRVRKLEAIILVWCSISQPRM